jgi:hypothetical protein
MATETKTKKTPKKTTAKKATKKAVTKKTAKPTVKKTVAKKVTAPKTTKIVQEENNYKNITIASVIIAVIFIVGIIVIQNISKNGGVANYVPTQDETNFKKEYESLNGTSAHKVEIIKDNNIVYIDMKKASEILESGSGVIYFGSASCEECRVSVPVLLEAMSSSELETIYYVDLTNAKNLRDEYVLNEKNKAKIKLAATAEYDSVRLALANHLEDYVLTTAKGKKVNTGQKRLQDLTVISVVEGQVMGFHEGTVENHKATEKLNKEQEEDLLESYTKVISSQLNKKCTIETGC